MDFEHEWWLNCFDHIDYDGYCNRSEQCFCWHGCIPIGSPGFDTEKTGRDSIMRGTCTYITRRIMYRKRGALVFTVYTTAFRFSELYVLTMHSVDLLRVVRDRCVC